MASTMVMDDAGLMMHGISVDAKLNDEIRRLNFLSTFSTHCK